MKREKLELKHLVSYLPYGLKIQYKEANDNFFTEELFHIETKMLPDSRRLPLVNKMLHLENVKPFLKKVNTVSDEEIELIIQNGIDIKILNGNDITMLKYFIRTWDNYLKAPLFVAEILFEHHFDVFGLIEQGIAIDINTL